MRYGWHDGPGWGAMVVMGLMMMIFWGAVIALAVAALRPGSWGRRGDVGAGAGPVGPVAPAGPTGDGSEEALRILNERLARGDIDTAEYTSRREVLRGGR